MSGSADSIVMVEGGSLEISEAEMLEALKVAQKGIRDSIGLEKQLIDKAGAGPEDRVDQGGVGCRCSQAQVRDARRGRDGAGHQRQGQGRRARPA